MRREIMYLKLKGVYLMNEKEIELRVNNVEFTVISLKLQGI
jgi:hypothetical protein